MPTSNVSLRDIAAAITDELQLGDSSLSVSQVTVSVTYQVNKQTRQDDWLDDWYQDFKRREISPF